MQVAYLLYDRFTALDITGPHDVLNSVPGTESVFVAEQAGPVRNESDTLSIVADRSIADVTSPGILVVPGGYGTRALLEHEPLLSWIRQVHETTTWTTSVCTGALILGAERADWQDLALDEQPMRLLIEGVQKAKGTGAAVLGHPLNALIWFVNQQNKRGLGLRAGEVVTTGTCTGLVPVSAGQTAIADFGALGPVSVRFRS